MLKKWAYIILAVIFVGSVVGYSAYLINKGTPALNEMKAIEQQSKEYSDLKQKVADDTNSKLAELDGLQTLKNELDTLVLSDGTIINGKVGRAAVIINELNEELGTNLTIDDNNKVIGTVPTE